MSTKYRFVFRFYNPMLAIKIEIVCAMTTADPPKTAAPVQLTTPPDVYALGMY